VLVHAVGQRAVEVQEDGRPVTHNWALAGVGRYRIDVSVPGRG